MTGSRPLAPDPDLWPTPDLIRCWRWSYSFSCSFNQLFAIILSFAVQSFWIVWLIVQLDVRSCSALQRRQSKLLIHFSFGCSIVLDLSFGLLLNCSRSWPACVNHSWLLAPLRNCSWLSKQSFVGSARQLCSTLVGRWVSRFLDLACVNRSQLSAPQTTSGKRQNLSWNRLRTCIWPSTRITLDDLATTRSSTLSKLLARLGNLRPLLPRAAIVSWSWCWRSKSYVSCV